MIFVSAGTGFAPMRAFLWERLALRRNGVRSAKPRCSTAPVTPVDELYQERSTGSTPRACSTTYTSQRHGTAPRKYVQDASGRQGVPRVAAAVRRRLRVRVRRRPMRDAVRSAFVDVVAKHAKMPARSRSIRRRPGERRPLPA